MTGIVITMEQGRKRLQEAQETKERFKARRVALGLSNAPAGSVGRLCCMCESEAIMSIPIINFDNQSDAGEKRFCAEHSPWPGGIDDLEIGK